METMDDIRKHYRFSRTDEDNLPKLAEILLPIADELARDFYDYLMEDPRTASYFPTEAAVERRKETIKAWLQMVLTEPYDRRLLMRLERIGEVHVKIGLSGHHVNAAMNFIRTYTMRHVISNVADRSLREELLETLNKILDINLDIMTSSYREAELKKVFISYRVESTMIQWSERFMQGLNLILTIGLLVMEIGRASCRERVCHRV